jgi:hypothetical protein
MRSGPAILAALLSALAVAASLQTTGGGYYLFFTGLAVAGLVVAAAIASPRPGSVELARLLALTWDGIMIVLAILGSGLVGQASSPPPAPTVWFLGLPVPVFQLVAAYGGAMLVTLAAFGTPRASRLVIGWQGR